MDERPRRGIGAVTAADYDRAFAVNAKSLFFLTRRALELMPDGGRIVNIGSGVTRIAFPEAIAYAMTKGAVDTFTLALAKELGRGGLARPPRPGRGFDPAIRS